MRYVTLSALALLLTACGGGEPAIAPQVELAPIEISHVVIPEQSAVTVSALQQGERFTGTIRAFDADIAFDPDDLGSSQVRVRLPLASLDLGNADRNDAVPGKVWFNTKLHPVATFESTRIRRDGAGYVADGELTMKGLRRAVSLPFTLEERGEQTVMRGSVELDRTEWNLGEAPWDTEEWVGHAVRVDVGVVAERVE